MTQNFYDAIEAFSNWFPVLRRQFPLSSSSQVGRSLQFAHSKTALFMINRLASDFHRMIFSDYRVGISIANNIPNNCCQWRVRNHWVQPKDADVASPSIRSEPKIFRAIHMLTPSRGRCGPGQTAYGVTRTRSRQADKLLSHTIHTEWRHGIRGCEQFGLCAVLSDGERKSYRRGPRESSE